MKKNQQNHAGGEKNKIELSEWFTKCVVFVLRLVISQILSNDFFKRSTWSVLCTISTHARRKSTIIYCFHVEQRLTNDRNPFGRQCSFAFKVSLLLAPLS